MNNLPQKIRNEQQLEELLSHPSPGVVKLMERTDGDLMIIGVTGKIGPSLARTCIRACREAAVNRTVYGVARFSDQSQRETLEQEGVRTLAGDLLDPEFIRTLPSVRNIFYLAGRKFGSSGDLPATWAVNSYIPSLIAEKFRDSRIVSYSTGCVYPLVEISSGGSRETDGPSPIGEYAQSCLGRERMFEFHSARHGTPMALIRLNYAVEMRYGVLVDICQKVAGGSPIDLTTGYFNIIWQGDSNNQTIQLLEHVSVPPLIVNMTGTETLSVREVAMEFGQILGKEPIFRNSESRTALLSNSSRAVSLLGKPAVPVSRLIDWTARWILDGNRTFSKATHFEVRDGIY